LPAAATTRAASATSREEAGVAHGLLYHYFKSKDEVLEAVFRDAWGDVLEAFRGSRRPDEKPREQLGHVAAILLRSWRRDPDLVRVLVREIGRSPQVQTKVDELGQAFTTIERIVARGQREGTFRTDLDARLLSWIFYGGIEEILTGWVLGPAPGQRRGRRARGADGCGRRVRRMAVR
jgi:AcrR family transcriptional regulator